MTETDTEIRIRSRTQNFLSSRKDQIRFFSIAMGSLRECQAVLTLLDLTDTEAWKVLDSLGAHLYRLIQKAT